MSQVLASTAAHPDAPRTIGSCSKTQGYPALGRTVDAKQLYALQNCIDGIMLGHCANDDLMMQLDLGGDYAAMAEQTVGFKGARLDYRKIERLERDPLFLAFLKQPLFRDLCHRSYGRSAAISALPCDVHEQAGRQRYSAAVASGWGCDLGLGS